MTIRHLNVFIKVVDEGGVSRAAQKLFTSQPSVSQTIAELESYYGIKLFERLNRKLYLTSDGEKLLEYARHICASFNEMELSVGTFKDYGLLKIGATVTIGTCLLSQYVMAYNGEIEALVANTSAIEQQILLNKIDIGLIEGNVVSRDIVTIPFYKDEMIFVSSSGEYNSDTFILRENGSGTRELVQQELELMNLAPKNTWCMCNTEAIKNAVKNGLGITAMSKLLLTQELASNQLVQIFPNNTIYRNFVIAYHKNKFQNPHFTNFLNIVK